MLQSKFAKKETAFRAQKIFTDRMEPRHVLDESLQNIAAKPLEVITYYGKGGIGKSRLLKELLAATEAYKDDTRNVVPIFLSLDAYDYANPINILTAIRNYIKGDCTLFDYAMTLYCAKTKMTIEDIKDKRWNLSSNVLEHVNDILALVTLNAAIPLKWIGSAINAIKDHQFRVTYQEEVLELSQLNEFEIFERLPYYLGLCIQQAALEGTIHILFLDSYESLLARTYGQTPSVECDEWLRELFLAAGTMRLVIASRDKLKWEQADPEWEKVLNQHRLNNLSDDDARWFLKQAPINDEAIINFIVRNSKGVPLYLDMCIDVYESLFNTYRYKLTSEIYEQQGNFYSTRGKVIIDRYLRHLTDKQHNAVKVLAAVHAFSRTFAMKLLQRANLPHYYDEMTTLLEKSIILPVDTRSDTWKLDESIRSHIWNCMPRQEKTDLITNVLSITAEDSKGQNFVHFANTIELLLREPALIPPVWDTLLAQTELYANGGYWNEMHGLLSQHITHPDTHISTIAVISEIICQRRFGNLRQAETLINSHPIDLNTLGTFAYNYRYLCTYIQHLLGNYEQAIKSYASLIEEMELIRVTLPPHVYIQTALKYADLLYLKGHFEEALQQVDQLLTANPTAADKVEALRIKGHIYRFSKQYAKARVVYSSAMDLIRDSRMAAYTGKLLTNFTEANCFEQPEQALIYFQQAAEANKDNSIELGKCYAAASIAYSQLGKTQEAFDYAQKAHQQAQNSGYQAGHIFALAAQHLAQLTTGNTQAAAQTRQELEQLVNKLGVYPFINQFITPQ